MHRRLNVCKVVSDANRGGKDLLSPPTIEKGVPHGTMADTDIGANVGRSDDARRSGAGRNEDLHHQPL